MTIPDRSELKRQLRTRMRTTHVDAMQHNAPICALAAHWLEENPKITHIALYHPLPDEPDLRPLMDRLPGRTWYFPRISEKTMTFHAVSSLNEDLTPGVFGILEPKPCLPAVDPKEIQAYFCPGLAFEKSTGLRLGRGKGYYDRYLAQSHAESRRIGVTFPERLVEDTFSEPHDMPMDLVIS